MSTTSQITANQLNAQHSTGPKTPEGKLRSSLNATRHGFTAQAVLITAPELSFHKQHCEDYRNQFHPVGKLETDLVQEISSLRWALDRIRAHEDNLFAIASQSSGAELETGDPEINSAIASAHALQVNMKILSTLSIYEQRKLRAFEKALKLLTEAQSSRRHAESLAAYKNEQNEQSADKSRKNGFVRANGEKPNKTSPANGVAPLSKLPKTEIN